MHSRLLLDLKAYLFFRGVRHSMKKADESQENIAIPVSSAANDTKP